LLPLLSRRPGVENGRRLIFSAVRRLFLLLLLLLIVMVPVGYAETAKVHQPAGVRAVVLRFGARQAVVVVVVVVTSCDICNVTWHAVD